jgi:hypothetical protein
MKRARRAMERPEQQTMRRATNPHPMAQRERKAEFSGMA